MALIVALAASAAALSACTASRGPTGSRAWQQTGTVPPTPVDATFLAQGECAARDAAGAYREVDCSDPDATAQVVSRLYGVLPEDRSPATAARAGNRCPETTDFVLTMTAGPSKGHACMRNLDAPHPGDPGQGGGPRTITGDCVYTTKSDEVRETACDGSGGQRPQYRLTAIARTRAACPPGTALYVDVGPAGVGCARRL